MPSAAGRDSPGVTQRWSDPRWECGSPRWLRDCPCFFSSQAQEWGWAAGTVWVWGVRVSVRKPPRTALLLPPTLALLDVPSSASTGAQAQAACGCEPLESPQIFSTRDSGTTEAATLPLSLPSPILCSGRQDGMKGHDPQTRPAHLTPTLFSGPASDFGQGRASWPNGSFVSPTVLWTPDCFVLFSLSTEHPLAGTLAGFQKQDTPSGPRGPADS